jgi:uncharacterized protein involved in exopolysaccharide biosynthesis
VFTESHCKPTLLLLLNARTSLASAEARQAAVSGQLATARQSLAELNADELRLVQLQRELELADASYRKYSDNLEQARIDEALDTQRLSNINIVQPATLEARPVSPRKLVNLILGVLVGCIGGLGIAVVAERFDRSLKSADEVQAELGLPALVDIPRLATSRKNLNGAAKSR